MLKMFILSFIVGFTFLDQALAAPKAVILIRHAEEPHDDETYLSKKGVERSRRLPKLFKDHPKLRKLGAPVALFAAGAKGKNSSVRSIQTLHFLSQALKISINDSYLRDDVKDLTEEILENNDYDDKVVVICWQHRLLPVIAERLGVKEAPNYPHEKFDRVWLITYNKKDKKKNKVQFDDFAQKLLPGDDSK